MKYFGTFTPDGWLDGLFTIANAAPTDSQLGIPLPTWADLPPRPSTDARVRMVAGALVWQDPRTLDQIKASKWADIKAERTRREAATFAFGAYVLDSNPVNLAGAALDALLAKQNSEVYSQPWVLTNNTVVAFSADQMIAAARAGKAYIAALWVTSQTLRGQIFAAQDAAAVAAVVWPAAP